jgi:hypothetical protein
VVRVKSEGALSLDFEADHYLPMGPLNNCKSLPIRRHANVQAQVGFTADGSLRSSMSCKLVVGGAHLKVDDLLGEISLVPDSVSHKGDQISISGITGKIARFNSGARFVVSDAVKIWTQIDEAVLFLRADHAEVKKLSSFPGVELARLDFDAQVSDPPWGAIFMFPIELLSLSSSAGLSLCLSIWPESEETLDALELDAGTT